MIVATVVVDVNQLVLSVENSRAIVAGVVCAVQRTIRLKSSTPSQKKDPVLELSVFGSMVRFINLRTVSACPCLEILTTELVTDGVVPLIVLIYRNPIPLCLITGE